MPLSTGASSADSGLRYREILDQQTEMICRFTTDLVVTYANRAYASRYGHDSDSIIGHCLLEFFPEESHEWAVAQVKSLGPGQIRRHENEVTFPGGGRAWYSWTDTAILDDDGNVMEVQAVGRDITESRVLAEAMRRSEERFRRAFDDAPIGMAILDEAGGVIRTNLSLCEFLGVRGAGGVVGRSLAELVFPSDAEAVAHPADIVRQEIRFLDRSGVGRWGQLSLSRFEEEGAGHWGWLMQVVDLDDRKRAEQRLAHQALHDSLTGLPNRSLLFDRLEHALQRRRRAGGEVAVLFGDLDQFKCVNDTLGHESGDVLLRLVAERLALAVRDQDTLARFGGDEFVVLAEGLEARAEAREIANRLVAALREPVELEGRAFCVDLSVGIALATDGSTASQLIRSADAAMYVAKNGRVPRIAFFDPAP
jgi:diguanylate cyclase (GGDEF)-like protein/PAS domain S-box-containing protein